MLYGRSRLLGVHPDLVRLAEDVASTRDILLVEGARSLASELKAMQTHHSSLKDPMNSKHVTDPIKRPLALAIDVGPWPLDWNDIPAFVALAAFVKERAAALSIPIAWGGDWTTFKDYDHFELANVVPPTSVPCAT